MERELKPMNSIQGDTENPTFSIGMETSMGKTYVYMKIMFEQNKRYGWCKFIISSPALRFAKGLKSFETMQEHFATEYGKHAQFFFINSE